MHCSAHCLFHHNLTPTKQLLLTATSSTRIIPPSSSSSSSSSSPPPSNPILRRRDFTASSLLLLFTAPSKAETLTCTNDPSPTKQAFLDVSIDGQPAGRIIVGLYEDVAPHGASRFAELVSGRAGVSYRRKEFVKIMPNYVQHGGLRSYGVDAELAKKTGSNLANDRLVYEWESQAERCPRGTTQNVARSVSIIVRDPLKPPPKTKLVARKGKLEIDEEEVAPDPNGTEFVIAVKDSPELDGSALVVGRVLEGMEVVERIAQVKTVQENTSSPYFRVAKLIGDKRAVVAERGFNRPYSKVLITNCGLIG